MVLPHSTYGTRFRTFRCFTLKKEKEREGERGRGGKARERETDSDRANEKWWKKKEQKKDRKREVKVTENNLNVISLPT
jgi:hypothetical protein